MIFQARQQRDEARRQHDDTRFELNAVRAERDQLLRTRGAQAGEVARLRTELADALTRPVVEEVATTWAQACATAKIECGLQEGCFAPAARRFRFKPTGAEFNDVYFAFKTPTAVGANVCPGGKCRAAGCKRQICAFEAAVSAMRSFAAASSLERKADRAVAHARWREEFESRPRKQPRAR